MKVLILSSLLFVSPLVLADGAATTHPAPSPAGQMQVSHATDDAGQITHLLKASFDKPDAPLSVEPVVVAGEWAVAGWVQQQAGGRALLKQSDGSWHVHLCTGASLKEASSLEKMGVPAERAAELALALAEAEKPLPAEKIALFDSFKGEVKGTAMQHAHHQAQAGHGAAPVALVSADGAFAVEAGFVRAVPPGQANSAAFMTLKNTTHQAHALVGASSTVSAVAELHTHTNVDGVMQMRRVDKIDLPAGGQAELKPGGLHVMLIDLKKELKVDEQVDLVLKFDNGSEMSISIPVKPVMAAGMGGQTAGQTTAH